ncbi:MAG: signal peptidase II [Deltaproteobacteria bacterium]|nr:signal peptidase II [Deltaproteobacteria bacterium]
MSNRILLAAVIAGIILFLDQLTKTLIAQNVELHQRIPMLAGFFDLTHMRNPGAAFSFLAQAPDWFRQPFFLIATSVAIAALIFFILYAQEEGAFFVIAAASILGGAIGNLIDRLLYGEVIDFLLFYWHDWAWPAFNVADSCITIGVIGLLWASWKQPSTAPHEHAST